MLEIKHLSSAGVFDIIHMHVHEQALGWFSFTFGLIVIVVDNEPSKLSCMTVTVKFLLLPCVTVVPISRLLLLNAKIVSSG